jgi:hypothetical protein
MPTFDEVRISTSSRLFADKIEDDLWCMFHGTSGHNRASIERHGFASGEGAPPRSAIQDIIDIFRKIKWAGDHGGGYPVLKLFSMDYDLRNSGRSPLFFAETSMRALLYVCRDFSGGEKLRAVRYALADLDRYLEDQSLREGHWGRMAQQYNSLTALNAHPDMLKDAAPITVDLDWLRDVLEALKPVRQIADDAWLRHDGGIVFALRLTKDDLEDMSYNGAMGIEVSRPIPPSRIVDRVVVPADYEVGGSGRTGDDTLRRLRGGLIAALKAEIT